MLNITLPDGSVRQYENPTSGRDIAASIGSGLAKAALAVRVDGVERDLSDPITADASVAIITAKEDAGVDIIRHSTAHLLGHALKQLWPEAKMVIGPVIENGFYYDIDSEHRFTPEDLEKLEARMKDLAATGYAVEKVWTPVADARKAFSDRHEDFKLRLIDDFDDSVKEVGLYHHQEYLDMCRGPHVPHMGHVKAFKLTKLSGSYWRGDASGEPLQRIYGVAFADQKTLDAYLQQQAEAEKRDHRRIGKQLDFFHLQEEAPGMVFWHAKGWVIYREIENYMRGKLRKYGYEEVQGPQILDRSLWEKSGHWDKFGGNMFTCCIDEHDYAIKPMNCPGHIQIFNQGLRSYRELPVRYAEFGICHRNEPSGTLHGLMRVRRFVQDDGHIFCTRSQIREEIERVCQMVYEVYHDFGFDEVELALSTRPEKRVGSDEIWDEAEADLQAALEAQGKPFRLQPGEGAFYGPKIEFTLKDSLGRRWQCGTVQLDFSMPERLGAHYIDENDVRQTPVMIHRAILGSLERFIGILIEQYAGQMPLWLSPVQAVVMPITDAQADYATAVAEKLATAGLRVEKDLRNEKINYKIREHTLQRVPFMLVAGDREKAASSVSVRQRDGKDLGVMSVDDLITHLQQLNSTKAQEI
ncbi:threonine--tRNA ligase [Cardiobacterium hominis]|jgi:threonine--tRNA ligase|uniref:Threonine--tRNA ligase n=1 Tax=Cardiobacterium hominis (strain ATCC 15826 / DSM 8339 / NCTC 10426 / 6573) TaxID=638300 RepID=C8N8I9_CARH6|nr:threonine--tRNA ligase [Cardiobacterium hominis]EEV89038.1 threonine--tRNA ligase [Cardiobacterium hominis ATCC 15826]VEG76634.1 Threonine--tRNA ligase [Cardiobacterium hominis]